ncbi:MAG: HAMP domain-containing sensor histidine kinase [Slackia sp.]|nr:HAMP domain-containing sensor histidine kinase [Slackia sp.]
MLKRLRAKFIALNIASVLLVIGIALCGVCLVEHQRAHDNGKAALNGAIDQAMRATDGLDNPTGADTDMRFDGPVDENENHRGTSPKIGSGERPYTVPAVVYRTDGSGETAVVSPDSTAVAADQDAIDASLSELEEAPDGLKILSQYGLAAMKRTTGDGTYFAFVDAVVFDAWKSLAFRLVFAGVGILAILFVLNIFFARWALRPVEQAWAAQRRFVADASHELKTPLTVILANASILARHPEKTLGEQMQWVEGTQEEAMRMQELVADMLSLAQAESKESSERTRVDMSALVSKEVLQFESVAFERHVSIADETGSGIYVDGDARKLEKLVGTLVDNACKYAQENSVVTVRLTTEGRKTVLAVHNMGNPIPPDDLNHVFDRFYRADKARTRDDAKSFGLGLAIAHEIAQSHGGAIRACSSEADGTTFTVTLPLAK